MHQYPPQPKQEFWQPYMMQPQPSQQPPKRNIGKFFAIICGALVLVIIIIAAIAHVVGSNPSSGNNAATVGQRLTVTPSGILFGSQPCPSFAQSSAHWEMIMGISAAQKVEGVMCGYLMGVPSLQAVVMVRYGGTASLLDINVYTNIMSAHPSRFFSSPRATSRRCRYQQLQYAPGG